MDRELMKKLENPMNGKKRSFIQGREGERGGKHALRLKAHDIQDSPACINNRAK